MSSSTAPVLPERPKRRIGWVIGAVVVVVALVVAGFLLVPRLVGGAQAEQPTDGAGETAGEPTVVTIGVTSASEPQWPILQEILLEQGIDLQTINFTEYPLPNPALAAGETDLNLFQHLDYLSNHNLATGDDLQPISSTIIVPLPLYSTKHESIDDFPQGAQVAIPSDPSNQGRAINVLVSAGLVNLIGEPLVPTPADIDTANSIVTVIPVEASQAPAALQSADGAIINNNFAQDAGLDPNTALYSVDPADPLSWPYLNVIVARAEDVDNEIYLKVAKAWHSPEVEAAVLEASGGTAVIQDVPGDELRDRLKQIEDEKRAAQ
jgi:D-methionine transport system substrate-binding protein